MKKIDRDRLPYKNTRPCDHPDCSDFPGSSRATVHTELIGFLCRDHGMLALIAGLKPIALPEAAEGLRIMMGMDK